MKLLKTWHIAATTFPMWTSVKCQYPTITYELLQEAPLKLIDTVRYTRKAKRKQICGIDTWTESGFTWRGKGILAFLKSKWSIVYLDDHCLVIRFERSLVTPAGIDALVAQPQMKPSSLDLTKCGLTAKEVAQLTFLPTEK
jgi:hypothetical protein